MGVPNLNDSSIQDIEGRNRRMIVPEGDTFNPKQLHLDKKNGKQYWSDWEGMLVLSSNLDGSRIETLVETGYGDADRRDAMEWCVGITVDAERRQIYFDTERSGRRQTGARFFARVSKYRRLDEANRTDIEVLFDDMP
jgi:hypothetical protein